MAHYTYAIPDDWSEEQDGFISVLFCIPNSPRWRGLITAHIDALSYGRIWKRNTGTITEAQEIGREIFRSLYMGCIEELVKTNKALIAALTGEQADLTTPLPDQVDYSENGLRPTLIQMLEVDRLIYGDMNVAEVLFEALIGRKYEGLPLPFEGVGLADITDEQLAILHNRFRQFDLSFPGGIEKNITETLETLLRTDKLTDLEFITPNVATLMNQVFKLENDNPLAVLIQEVMSWLLDEPYELPEYNTIAELLLLIGRALQKVDVDPEGSAGAVSAAIEALRTTYETRSVAETVASNTNFDKLEDVIDAVENVLGGTFDPDA